MKKLVLYIVFGWMAGLPVFAQVSPEPPVQYDRDEYNRLMQKNKSLKKAGWWMLGGGSALVGGSIVWFLADGASNVLQGEDPDVDDGPTVMMAVGLLSMAGSVPVFISAGGVRKKAELSLAAQPVTTYMKPGAQSFLPALKLRVSLSR
jgi:hypothetical protein